MEKQLSKRFETLNTAHLIVKLGVDREMEVIVDFSDLSQVFVLHFPAREALFAVGGWVGIQNLVDDDVVDIDLLFCKLNSKALSLVH